jgi:adenylate cyclase
MSTPQKTPKFVLTIGRKLISLNSMQLMLTIAALMWIVTTDLTTDNTALIQQNNAEAAVSLANQTRNIIENAVEKTSLLGRMMVSGNSADQNNAQDAFFSRDKNFLGVMVFKQNKDSKTYDLEKNTFSPEFTSSQDAQIENLISMIKTNPSLSIEEIAKSTSLYVTSFALAGKGPVLALATSVGEQNNGASQYVFLGLMSQNAIVSNFLNFESINAFLVDRKGTLLAHTDPTKIVAKENVSDLAIVKKLLEGKSTNHTMQYKDFRTGERKLGAFQSTGIADLSVVIEVPEAKAFESARQIQRRAFWISLVILSLSFLLGYLFSESISRPISRLSEAAIQIAKGDFNISLKSKGNDEISQLSQTFNKMAVDLKQRISLIRTFEKFHTKEIAEQLMSGDISVGGETKKTVVFFSDIRGFTSMSENMPAHECVEMLNEYLKIMVNVIRNHKGVVDKFVGDAIMALWGVPNGSPDDVSNALKACIQMRQELQTLNETRIARGKAAISIGMGLNYGDVIAGVMGSDEKMEYTVIGDTVNVASRIESLTKELKTDLLISKSIKEAAGDAYEVELCESIFVKGKAEALEVYKVTGVAQSHQMIDVNHGDVKEEDIVEAHAHKVEANAHEVQTEAPSMEAASETPAMESEVSDVEAAPAEVEEIPAQVVEENVVQLEAAPEMAELEPAVENEEPAPTHEELAPIDASAEPEIALAPPPVEEAAAPEADTSMVSLMEKSDPTRLDVVEAPPGTVTKIQAFPNADLTNFDVIDLPAKDESVEVDELKSYAQSELTRIDVQDLPAKDDAPAKDEEEDDDKKAA